MASGNSGLCTSSGFRHLTHFRYIITGLKLVRSWNVVSCETQEEALKLLASKVGHTIFYHFFENLTRGTQFFIIFLKIWQGVTSSKFTKKPPKLGNSNLNAVFLRILPEDF